MSNILMIIPFAIIALLIIIVIIVLLKRSKKDDEIPASILDVDKVGVSDNNEFSYGYEKEETIVMQPVSEEKTEEENTSSEDKEEKE